MRAALLGAVAVAAVGAVTIQALPLSTYPAVAAATVASTGPASFADVVDHVKGAVVSVKVKMEEANAADDGDSQAMPSIPKGSPLEKFFRQFGAPGMGEHFGAPQHEHPHIGMAQGSGFFISPDGYIVTNNHVVDHAEDVPSPLRTARELRGSSARTASTDLALFKVKEGTDILTSRSRRSRRGWATG